MGRLTIGEFDLLVTGDASSSPLAWGCYPMVPWAGRLRHGRFEHDGRIVEMPIDMAPHAIHGTGYTSAWDVLDQGPDFVELDVALAWPLGGRAHQHVQLTPDAIVCVLTVVAGHESLPVTLGWHPWFVKPESDHLEFGAYYPCDGEQIPTGELARPPQRPWDHCFVEPVSPLELVYRHGLRVRVESDCDHWVVYDQPAHATCVEPQSGPPNAVNMHRAQVVPPGEMLQRTMTARWDR